MRRTPGNNGSAQSRLGTKREPEASDPRLLTCSRLAGFEANDFFCQLIREFFRRLAFVANRAGSVRRARTRGIREANQGFLATDETRMKHG